ncbi:MAG TPA: hypothetical protein VHW05_13245 [Phenylobacterium sp.]|jgi:hypothetical protein|nr:hypothetical protein [Phenylobacterium sp.]
MIRRLALALALTAGLAACQSVGPVHIGEINQGRATALAQTELQRRHLEAYAGWRSEVSDYGALWEVTFYRPADRKDGPPLVRIAVNKKNEHIVSVSVGE